MAKQSITPPSDPTPLAFDHRSRGESISEALVGGTLRFELPDGNTMEVEGFIRPGNSIGLLIRGLDCYLDIEPQVANVVIVKPRPR